MAGKFDSKLLMEFAGIEKIGMSRDLRNFEIENLLFRRCKMPPNHVAEALQAIVKTKCELFIQYFLMKKHRMIWNRTAHNQFAYIIGNNHGTCYWNMHDSISSFDKFKFPIENLKNEPFLSEWFIWIQAVWFPFQQYLTNLIIFIEFSCTWKISRMNVIFRLRHGVLDVFKIYKQFFVENIVHCSKYVVNKGSLALRKFSFQSLFVQEKRKRVAYLPYLNNGKRSNAAMRQKIQSNSCSLNNLLHSSFHHVHLILWSERKIYSKALHIVFSQHNMKYFRIAFSYFAISMNQQMKSIFIINFFSNSTSHSTNNNSILIHWQKRSEISQVYMLTFFVGATE